MAKTHGRSPLPIPESLDSALRGMGMVRIDGTVSALYRDPRRPDLRLTVTRTNMPGSDNVSYTLSGAPGHSSVGFTSPDRLSGHMRYTLADLDRRMR